MNDLPAVTVITATYNSSKTLKFTIKSVLNQDFKDFEYYIVGDCCTDDTEQVVNSFNDQRIKWINLNKNSGSQSGPNNQGLKRAKGKYVAYLGHDDLWFPWHLSKLHECIENYKVGLVHSLCARIGPEVTEWPVGPPYFESNYRGHHCPPSTWLHIKNLVEKCGTWPDYTDYHQMVDTQYLNRMNVKGIKIKYIPELSVIKFDSRIWGTYSKNINPPLKKYMDRILDNPIELQKSILLDIATELARLARKTQEIPTIAKAFRMFYLAIKRYLFNFVKSIYGEHKWPLSIIIQKRSKKSHEKDRIRRGLKPYFKN